MSRPEKINKEQRLYVMKCGNGYSCLGFDVLERRASRLATELGLAWHERKGTLKAFAHYHELMEIARDKSRRMTWRSTSELTPQLMGLEGCRVEVETTYGEVRRFIVGRSTGWIPCHLEIHNVRSTGGGSAEHENKRVTVIRRGR